MTTVVRQQTRKDGPIGVMYVEVNNVNFVNSSCYSLSTTGEPLFDISIIFAANINYDVPLQRHILHFNAQVTQVLTNADRYVRPVQAKGIKVLLSILGNHQGAGVCNFRDAAGARDFAIQLRDAVNLFGLDGIDFDDEYADYGQNGTTQPNAFSFIYLLRELRAVMPDKIISFYYYGPAASRLSFDGMVAGDFVNYSWNAIYGSYSPPNVPGLDRSQLGPAAVWINNTSSATAQSLATRTVDEGYGVYLMYDLPGNDANNYLSGISSRLYGAGSNLQGGCLQPWPFSAPSLRETVHTTTGDEEPTVVGG